MAPKAVSRVGAKKAGESVQTTTGRGGGSRPKRNTRGGGNSTKRNTTAPRGGGSRSKRNTTASRGGGNSTQRHTTASRGAGSSTKRKIPSTPQEALDFALDTESGDDSYDDVEVQVEDIDLARAKALSDQKFVHLKNFLIKKGMDAGHPYKDAMRKLLLGQVTASGVRERIVKYIQYKLTAVKKYLFELLLVYDWNDVVAGDIAELIKKELIEHLEVEVTEVNEIYQVAEEVRKESSERLQLARGEFLKDRARSWYYNTWKLGLTLRKWVKNPTTTFSSCDVPYDESFDRYEEIGPNFEKMGEELYVQDDIDLARAEAVSDEKFVCLNYFLIERGMDAGQPYKDAIRKLLQRQVTDSRVREHIVEYIQYKLTAVQKYLSALLVDHWNGVVAGEIAELIKNELIEHLEVEVKEVKEIYQVAEEARKESSERLQLARCGFLKNRVRSWLINTEKLGLTLKKWVKNPSASFSSCDEPYNYRYDRP